MTTLNALIDKFHSKHNDICIISDQLVRLIGVADDGIDYFYIGKTMMFPTGKLTWFSCVGRCESLKGKIDPDHYISLDATFELNGATKETLFQVDCRPLNEAENYFNRTRSQ